MKKAKLSLCLTNYTMETYVVWMYSYRSSALVVGEWSVSSLCRFTPEESHQYLLDRRLSGPLDDMQK
jgi:hypothetical protein